MLTGMQLAITGGALLGLGVVFLLWRLAPADPDLGQALERLSPRATTGESGEASTTATDTRDRLGRWGMKTLPAGTWGKAPVKELALLRIPLSRYYGEKILFALMGLTIPPLFGLMLATIGLGLPIILPVGASLAGAVAFFFLPDYNARDDAKKARVEFNWALGAYIELVALERNSGSGPRQAMELAAEVGDSWVFRRLGEELARTRWSGVTPWEALHSLSNELGLPELDDFADIMRLSGEEGAQIYTSLRARSAGMRAAMLNAEKTKANESSERMSIPMSALGVIFLAILVAPSLLRLMEGS